MPDSPEQFAEAIARPTVESSRYFVLLVVALIVIGILAGAIWNMLPLKEVQPWIVEVNAVTGERSLKKDSALKSNTYKPSQAVLDRELFNFVRSLYYLNADAPKMVEESIAEAYSTYARDRAVQQVREILEREQPFQRMKTIPGLARTVDKKTITYRSDAPVALIRFSSAEVQRGSTAPVVRNFAMQVTFVQVPPTKPEDIEKNPLGIYITHLDVQEER